MKKVLKVNLKMVKLTVMESMEVSRSHLMEVLRNHSMEVRGQ